MRRLVGIVLVVLVLMVAVGSVSADGGAIQTSCAGTETFPC